MPDGNSLPGALQHAHWQEAGHRRSDPGDHHRLHQDLQGEAPTAEYCTQYAEAKGVDPARLLMDNGAAGAWGVFQTSINMYDAGYIPWNAVLRGSNMEYLWADNVTDGTITGLEEAVEEALGKDVDFSVMLQE